MLKKNLKKIIVLMGLTLSVSSLNTSAMKGNNNFNNFNNSYMNNSYMNNNFNSNMMMNYNNMNSNFGNNMMNYNNMNNNFNSNMMMNNMNNNFSNNMMMSNMNNMMMNNMNNNFSNNMMMNNMMSYNNMNSINDNFNNNMMNNNFNNNMMNNNFMNNNMMNYNNMNSINDNFNNNMMNYNNMKFNNMMVEQHKDLINKLLDGVAEDTKVKNMNDGILMYAFHKNDDQFDIDKDLKMKNGTNVLNFVSNTLTKDNDTGSDELDNEVANLRKNKIELIKAIKNIGNDVNSVEKCFRNILKYVIDEYLTIQYTTEDNWTDDYTEFLKVLIDGCLNNIKIKKFNNSYNLSFSDNTAFATNINEIINERNSNDAPINEYNYHIFVICKYFMEFMNDAFFNNN